MDRSRSRACSRADPFAGAWQAGEEIDRAFSTIQNVYKYGTFSDHENDANHHAPWTTQHVASKPAHPKPKVKRKAIGRDIPFSRYTPNPYYNSMTNDLIQETYINLEIDYINSSGDISITSCSTCSSSECKTPGARSHLDPLDDDNDFQEDSMDSHRCRQNRSSHKSSHRSSRRSTKRSKRRRCKASSHLNPLNFLNRNHRKKRTPKWLQLSSSMDDGCCSGGSLSTNSSDSNFLLADSSSNWSLRSDYKEHSPCSLASSTMSGLSRDSDETVTSFIELDHPLLGMIFVVIAALLYATLNLSVKTLMYETPWQELMFVRMALTWIITTIWMVIQFRGGMNVFGPNNKRIRFLMLIRALCLWAAVLSCWWSFEFLPVGDGMTLAMSFPVFVSLFETILYRSNLVEYSLDIIGWICSVGGLVGIAFVGKPSFIFGGLNEEDTAHYNIAVGICLGLMSAICAAAQYTIVNYIKDDCHWLQIEHTSAALSTFILCPVGVLAFSIYDYQVNGHVFSMKFDHLTAVRWIEDLGLGLLGFCALANLTRGAQLDAPSRTSICLYFQIPFVYIGQFYQIRDRSPNPYIFLGMFLVLCAVITPAVRKLRAMNDDGEIKFDYAERRLMKRRNGRFDDGETLPLMMGEEECRMTL